MLKRVLIPILCFVVMQTGVLIMDAGWTPASAAGKKLVVGIADDPPYTFKNEQGEWAGLTVDLWRQIARDLKLDYSLKEMTQEEVLNSLQNGSIDLSADAVIITSQREQLFEFTVPIASTRVAVATLHDTEDHPWLAALKIFVSWGTLKIIAILLMILFLLGFIFWRIERKSNPEHFGEGLIRGIGSGIYWVGSTMTSGVCFGVSLKSVSGRVLGLFWMLICALALSAFIASLSSSLTTHHLSETKFGVDKMRRMHLGTEAGSVPASIVEKIGSRTMFLKGEEEVLAALVSRKIDGFIYDEATLQYYAEGKYRGIISVHPTSLKEIVIAFGMPHNSPLRKPINISLLKIIDEPVWESILSRYGLDSNFEARHIVIGREKKHKPVTSDE
ncbi:MAG: transporter substrate-binding domain-containing protein [Deltaproteobacteria bacterium]|nr:transporter substrate-binding domain-containing protein [Deltaproteobacteria bacterium]